MGDERIANCDISYVPIERITASLLVDMQLVSGDMLGNEGLAHEAVQRLVDECAITPEQSETCLNGLLQAIRTSLVPAA